MVIGIGTTFHKFECKEVLTDLLCLSYHLPTAEIRVFSPQTYHTLYVGHSTVFGDRDVKMIDHLSITIPLNGKVGNVPVA
jgi:hypothetical protein